MFQWPFSRWIWVIQKVSTLDFIGAKDDGGGVAAGAIRHAKLQSDRHHQQTNTQFYYRPDALTVGQPTLTEH